MASSTGKMEDAVTSTHFVRLPNMYGRRHLMTIPLWSVVTRGTTNSVCLTAMSLVITISVHCCDDRQHYSAA